MGEATLEVPDKRRGQPTPPATGPRQNVNLQANRVVGSVLDDSDGLGAANWVAGQGHQAEAGLANGMTIAVKDVDNADSGDQADRPEPKALDDGRARFD